MTSSLKVPNSSQRHKSICRYMQTPLCRALSAPTARGGDGPQILRTRGYPKVGHFQRPEYICLLFCAPCRAAEKIHDKNVTSLLDRSS